MPCTMLQDRAPASTREAPRPRGDARGDGVDPDRHAGRRPDPAGPVETEILPLLPGIVQGNR